MIDVLMPQLGESVAEGTVTKWLVHEGDIVTKEQPLVEVATDKADTEIPAPSAGRVTRLAVPEGTVVAKGGLLCTLDETASQGPKASATPAKAEPAKAEPAKAEGAPAETAPAAQGSEAREAGAQETTDGGGSRPGTTLS